MSKPEKYPELREATTITKIFAELQNKIELNIDSDSLFYTEKMIADALHQGGLFRCLSMTTKEHSELTKLIANKLRNIDDEKRISYIFRAYPRCIVTLFFLNAEEDIQVSGMRLCKEIISENFDFKKVAELKRQVLNTIEKFSQDSGADTRYFLSHFYWGSVISMTNGRPSKSLSETLELDTSEKTQDKIKNAEWNRLEKKIKRSFAKVKYICDIHLNDHEYELVKVYLKKVLKQNPNFTEPYCEEVYATALVHTAARSYKDGNLWGSLFSYLEMKKNQYMQVSIGEEFYDILLKYNKINIGEGKHFQNILLHCFVSDNYADAFFEFLYKFYYLDLDRDISRLNREMMNELMESICSEDNVGRRYMLVQHISQAMAANRRGAKIRIRNLLKLIDRFFWDENFELVTEHRVYNLLQSWVRASDELRADAEGYAADRRRGAKHFSKPNIFYDVQLDTMKLVIPSQLIKRTEEDVFWHISGGEEHYIEAEVIESVTGYKVNETAIDIAFKSCLNHFKVDLLTSEGEKIKSFNIENAVVKFFDEHGYAVASQNLKVGQLIAVSEENRRIETSGLYENRLKAGCRISYFQLEFEDIIKMPDGKAVIVGRKEVKTGITAKGVVSQAICRFEDREYEIYNQPPYLIIRLHREKINGTLITLNGQRHHISDFEAVEFCLEDLSDEVGIYMNLEPAILDKDGIYTVGLDVPGGIDREWQFVYLEGFKADFEDAPYIFKPRGTVSFPEHIKIEQIGGSCIKEKDSNSFKFEITSIGRHLNLYASIGNKIAELEIPVPAVYSDLRNSEQWTSERPSPIWHSEFPDIINLSVPYHKIILSMEIYMDEEQDGIREIEYRRNIGDSYICCDISRFRSYLRGGGNSRSLRMKFGDVDEELLKIMIHGILVSGTLMGDFEEKEIIIDTTILGQGSYYADIFKRETLIAEKLLLDEEGKARFPFKLDNDEYAVKVYEGEADESGFDDLDYYLIGEFSQHLLNPYDMTARSFKIMQIERKNEMQPPLRIGYYYFVENLQKTAEEYVYSGKMVVEKSDGTAFAAVDVQVSFPELEKPNYCWISFLDEYGEEMDFLYDTKREGILQNENPNLRKLVCYRRYTMLDYDGYIFHIDFIERKSINISGLPRNILFKEVENSVSFTTAAHRSIPRHKVYISELCWDERTEEILRENEILTLNQAALFTKSAFTRLDGMTRKALGEIEKAMNRQGFTFREH